jgi:hypothetical protein
VFRWFAGFKFYISIYFSTTMRLIDKKVKNHKDKSDKREEKRDYQTPSTTWMHFSLFLYKSQTNDVGQKCKIKDEIEKSYQWHQHQSIVYCMYYSFA